jgi:hypothetical protein
MLCTKCDIKQDKILSLDYLKKVDMIITSLCIEAVADTLEEYVCMIGRLSTMIKPGGHLIMFGVLEETFYKVEKQTLPCLSLTEKDIQTSLTKNNFEVLQMKTHRPEI